MGSTKIEWTDAVWNPITGCSKISEGCENCYAERMSKRLAGRCGYPKANPFAVTWHMDKLHQPLHWKKPRMVFVCSIGDLFHEDVSDDVILEVVDSMRIAKQHVFQLLTKRPERMKSILERVRFSSTGSGRLWLADNANDKDGFPLCGAPWHPKPGLGNVWLGVTAENQERADERIPVLLQTPAAVRFVSVEPMLGPVNLQSEALGDTLCRCTGCMEYARNSPDRWQSQRIDWVICGGETGPGARPMHPDWVRDLRDQCRMSGIPFFFKSWGEWSPFYDRDREDPDWRNIPKESDTVRRLNIEGGCGFHGERVIYLKRVGKKKAGALIDGREWREMPETGCCNE